METKGHPLSVVREKAEMKLGMLDIIELCFSAIDPNTMHIPLGAIYELRRIIINEYGEEYRKISKGSDE